MPATAAKRGLRMLWIQSMRVTRVRQFRSAFAILPFYDDPGAGVREEMIR